MIGALCRRMRLACLGPRHGAALAVVWLLAIACGFYTLMEYEYRVGEPSQVPRLWPNSSTLSRPLRQPRMVVFAHPRCPCTRATLIELQRLMARPEFDLDVVVVMWQPPNTLEWDDAELIRLAESLELPFILDPGGAETARFGISTSGHALVYGTEGRLRYSGGLTASRGHEGWSAGQDHILELARRPTVASSSSSAVFGCGMGTPTGNEGPPCCVGINSDSEIVP